MVFFNQMKAKPVIDCHGKVIGKILDFVFQDGMEFAKVTHVLYYSNDKVKRKINWKYVKEIKEKRTKKRDIELHLNCQRKELNISKKSDKDLFVSSLIDKQIIDVDGQKIVRANDVLLGKIKNKFCVVAVCVGTRSMLRVLGISKKGMLGEEKVIPWGSVETLDEQLHDLHLKYQKNKIADLHPSDIADIIEDLSHDERELIFDSLGKNKAAKTLAEVEPEVQESFLKNLKIARIVEILQNMPPNESADILSLMPEKRARLILSSMKGENVKKIREILDYPEESAASIMHTDFIAIQKNYTAQQTIDYLRKIKPSSESMYHLYVVDKDNKLSGVLSIRSLITANPRKKVNTFMNTKIAKVRLNTEKKDIAHALTKYNLYVLPVVDKKNVLKGIVKADEILEEIMPKSWKRGSFKRVQHKVQ